MSAPGSSPGVSAQPPEEGPLLGHGVVQGAGNTPSAIEDTRDGVSEAHSANERDALAYLVAHPTGSLDHDTLDAHSCTKCVRGTWAADAVLAAGFRRVAEDPASTAAALTRQNKHVRDLQALIGHMGKIIDALRAGTAEPTPLDLMNHPHPPQLPDVVADARAKVIRSLDLLDDLRAQLEGLEFTT